MLAKNKFYKLLKQENPDLNSIRELITIGSNRKFCGIKIGNPSPIGLFNTIGEDSDTVFTVLAKNRKLSDVITSIFDNAVAIVGRETNNLIDPEKSNRDSSVFIIVNSFLKNNKHGNNALLYSIQNEDYDVLDKIEKCGVLDNFQEYLGQLETSAIVKIVSTSVTEGYSNLFDFFFKILRHNPHHHYIPSVIKEFKEKEINLDENTKNKLTLLCHHSWNHILENINIEKKAKKKILTLINNSLEYDHKFKEQFAHIDVNLETYIVDDLCTKYLNNVETDYQIENLTPLFNMLNNTTNITGFIKESNMTTPIPNMNNSKNTSTTEIVIFSSLISFICGVLVASLYFIKNRQKIDSSDTDADGVDGNDTALQDQLVKKQTLDSNNFEEFFRVEFSRMKELAQSGELVKEKFLPKTLKKQMKDFVKSVEYTEDVKEQLSEMLQDSYERTSKFNAAQAYHIKYIGKMANFMKLTLKNISTNSVDDSTHTSVGTSVRFATTIEQLGSSNTAAGSMNPSGDNETTPLLGNPEAIEEV